MGKTLTDEEKNKDDGCTFNWQLNRSGQKSTAAKKVRQASSTSSLASSVRKSILRGSNSNDFIPYEQNGELLLSGSITIAGGLCLFAQEELSLTKFLAQGQNFSLHNDAVELAFS